MKCLITALFALSSLVGCVNPGIVEISPGVYYLARDDHAGIFGNRHSLAAGVIRDANAFASEKGKVAILISKRSKPVGILGDWASFEYTFQLVGFDDPRAGGGAELAILGERTGPAVLVATGTGFMVTKSGYLITAYHVIEDARTIRVKFGDGRTFPAKVEASSQSNDLALLKIEGQGFKVLPLSSSSFIEVGEELFTVGFPIPEILGAEPKYTSGALSSKSGIGGESSQIQITIPIQPGNSGGPVVTSKGRVVGIITSSAAVEAFLERTGSLPQNINWAIKAEYAGLMFEAEQNAPDTLSLEKAIERVLGAVCMIEVWNEPR